MRAYYNEIDKFAASWLRKLIKRGLISNGEVDERSIVDVEPNDLRGFDQCHFFAGIGGWSYALRLAGWPDDRFVWTGSCPCQPFSVAGKQRGGEDERHLWPAWFRLIKECRPPAIFGEQVAGASGLAWLDHVLADLEGEGYAAAAADLPACGIGAPHIRQRIYFLASSDDRRERIQRFVKEEVQGIDLFSWCKDVRGIEDLRDRPPLHEPVICSASDGIPGRVGRLRGYGNAIVPQVAAEVIGAYMGILN